MQPHLKTPQRDHALRPMPSGEQSARLAWAAQVQEALDDLDAIDRAAVVLTYRGLTQRQAARELGVPEATVRQRAARGLRQLAQFIAATSS